MRHLMLVLMLAGCASKAKKPTKTFGIACMSDMECISGRCLPGPTQSFCTAECQSDSDCASDTTVYCCEQSGSRALCTQPRGGACRQAALGDVCASPSDPFCARAGLECVFVDSTREICTKACSASAECSVVSDAQCTNVNGTALCVPPDPTTVRVSNCGGDADCSPGQICQFFSDNDANPTGLVTQCSDLQRGPIPAYGACTQDLQQCDRDFCEGGICPAVCDNDSYCRHGFACTRMSLVVRKDDPSTVANEQVTSVLGLCTKQPGSLTPCDEEATGSCPSGESCGFFQHFDGTLDARCQTIPMESGATNGVVVGDVCSPLVDSDGDPATPETRAPVIAGDGAGGTVSAVRVCAAQLQPGVDACFTLNSAPAFCTAPCRADSDCPSTRPSDGAAVAMACVYEPFEPLCLVTEFNASGKIDGSPCAAAGNDSADAQCASYYCDDSNTCAPRTPAGSACTRQDQCESLICLNGKCQQLCRADSDCASGNLCTAVAFLIDVDHTQDPSDDRYDLPTVCRPFATPRKACTTDVECGGGLDVCETVFNHDGTLSGVCATRLSPGLSLNDPCKTPPACNSDLCLGGSGAAVCSSVCGDDGDCGAGLRCMPTTLFGTAVDLLCAPKIAAASADGSACAVHSDCESNLCANGTCRGVCPKTAHAGDIVGAPSDGLVCVPTPVSVDARFTARTSDDRVGYVLAPTAATSCQSGVDCVYRPTSATTMQGFTLTPDPDARDLGADCQLAVNCKTGLCVAGACAAPCATVGDTCGDAEHTCSATAQALTYEGAAATVMACVAK